MTSSHTRPAWSRLGWTCDWLVTALGMMTLVGWMANVEVLASLRAS